MKMTLAEVLAHAKRTGMPAPDELREFTKPERFPLRLSEKARNKYRDATQNGTELTAKVLLGGSETSGIGVSGFSLMVTLPIPSPKLSPNARVHWASKAKLTKSSRLTAKIAALEAIGRNDPPMLKTATLLVRWYSRTTARQDSGNLIARLKASEDGLTDAGIWVDDQGVTWLPPIQLKDAKNPRVELVITN